MPDDLLLPGFTRRVRLRVTGEVLAAVFAPTRDGMPNFVVEAGLPTEPPAELVSVEHRYQSNDVVLIFEHPSFAAVPPGGDPPWLTIQARKWG